MQTAIFCIGVVSRTGEDEEEQAGREPSFEYSGLPRFPPSTVSYSIITPCGDT